MTREADAEREFRQEVIEFLKSYWPTPATALQDAQDFRRAAVERGYIWRHVPTEYGGSGQPADPIKALIIKEEFSRARAPSEYPNRSAPMIVGTLLAAGETWQKHMFVEKSLKGEIFWCQGYSEPNAGSDLASLRTKAVLDGTDWVINGQKVWTSRASEASHMFLMARTEPEAPKHQGISYLLLDMSAPGIQVRPLKQITGDTEFSEVFFDDVRTPANWIVGKRGEGWAVSRKTIAIERTNIGSSEASERLFNQLIKLATVTQRENAPAIKDPLIRDEIARLYGMLSAHKADGLHQINLLRRGEEPALGAGAYNKLFYSGFAERVGILAQKLMNEVAMASPGANERGPARWINQYMNSIAAQIGGGTSNMQRNMIAEQALGLPRDDWAARKEPGR